jgi:diguanylate cyclase (GGDEF)-like protein
MCALQKELERTPSVNSGTALVSPIDIKSIIDGLPDPALLVDSNCTILMYNTSFFDFFSVRPRQIDKLMENDESLKKSILGLFDINSENIKSIYEKHTVMHVADVVYKREDGCVFKGIRSFIPILSKDKQCFGVIIHFRDSSPEAKMQERYEKVLIAEKEYAEDLEKKVLEKTEKLTSALNEVTTLSRTDALTGLLNRQVFIDLTLKSIEVAQRYGDGLAIMMLDLDHFKQVNDTYGHQAGDHILQASTKKMREVLRENDYIGRYGGEEFIVCIKTNQVETVEHISKRCLDAIRSLPIGSIVPGKTDCQTISIGCALFPLHANNLSDLIKCADEALYEAKKNGRDRMVVFNKP